MRVGMYCRFKTLQFCQVPGAFHFLLRITYLSGRRR